MNLGDGRQINYSPWYLEVIREEISIGGWMPNHRDLYFQFGSTSIIISSETVFVIKQIQNERICLNPERWGQSICENWIWIESKLKLRDTDWNLDGAVTSGRLICLISRKIVKTAASPGSARLLVKQLDNYSILGVTSGFSQKWCLVTLRSPDFNGNQLGAKHGRSRKNVTPVMKTCHWLEGQGFKSRTNQDFFEISAT